MTVEELPSGAIDVGKAMLEDCTDCFQKPINELRTAAERERVTPTGLREGDRVDQILANGANALQQVVQKLRVSDRAAGRRRRGVGAEGRGVRVEWTARVTVLFKTSQFICDGNLWTAPIEDRELSRVQTSRRRDSEAAARQTGSEAGRT